MSAEGQPSAARQTALWQLAPILGFGTKRPRVTPEDFADPLTLLAGRRLEHDHQFSGYAAAACDARVSRATAYRYFPDTASAPHRTRRRADLRTSRAAPGSDDLTRL